MLAQACRADEGLTTNRTNNNVSTEFWGILMNGTQEVPEPERPPARYGKRDCMQINNVANHLKIAFFTPNK